MAKDNKPLLFGEDVGGDLERAIDSKALAFAGDDPNWIPGYSEQIRALDLKKAEYGSMSHQQFAHLMRQMGVSEVKEPPVRFKPVRAAGLNGELNDNVLIDKARYEEQGYRMATMDDLTRHGYSKPPMYTIAADGTIRRGDVALMVVDAAGAKRVADEKFRDTKMRESNTGTTGVDTNIPISVEMTRDPNFSF